MVSIQMCRKRKSNILEQQLSLALLHGDNRLLLNMRSSLLVAKNLTVHKTNSLGSALLNSQLLVLCETDIGQFLRSLVLFFPL